MTENQSIDFHEIKPLDGDKRKGFEELICQLARRQKNDYAADFRRVEGSGGDGGVEAYWLLEDGTKYGYQAKYFLSIREVDWSQIDRSVETAIIKHPEIRKYTIAIACDLTDRSGLLGKGSTGWEHWERHKIKWHEWTEGRGMSVEFIPWTKSDIIDILISDTKNRGLILYWFRANLFDIEWFKNTFKRIKADLGERFNPDDHVEIGLSRAFKGLSRSSEYLNYLRNWFNSVPSLEDLPVALDQLQSPFNQLDVQDLDCKCACVRQIGSSLQHYEAKPFPISAWQRSILTASEAISPFLKWLYEKEIPKDDRTNWARNRALKSLHAIDSHLDRTPIHLQSDEHDLQIDADLKRILIVDGEAGSGKSHLFADAVDSLLKENKPSLLLLGQYFPGKDIRLEFLNCLDLRSHDFEEVLQALNSAGEYAKTRLLILIDALNDAQELRIWPDQISGFAADIQKYEWLAFGASLRREYTDFLLPTTLREGAAKVTCFGIQTQEEQEKAYIQYFEKRGITRPAVPWLAPEFSNFLFLKVCCDSLAELGIKEFPRGLRGSLQLLEFYLKSVESKLKRRYPDTGIPTQAIRKATLNISRYMAESKADYITMEAAAEICDRTFMCSGPSSMNSWPLVLSSEGLLRHDHIYDKGSSDPLTTNQEVFRFTFQRFSDHLIVKALLEKIPDIENAITKSGPLSFLFERKWYSLWNALAIQVPEKYGKELLGIPSVNKDDHYLNYIIMEAFEESLLWRENTAFYEETLKLFNKLYFNNYKAIDILMRLATIQNHPWNAEFLDRNLQCKLMPERDAFWTTSINQMTQDDRPSVWELIQWTLRADLTLAETETLRLAALSLAWIFTSTNRPLRDTATKALIVIFVTRPEIIKIILVRFRNVDDLYVMERICAAVLGAVVHLTNPKCIKEIASAVYDIIFDRDSLCLHINLRDYARAIIEYALCNGCLDQRIDILKCTPPYKSEWPLTDTLEDKINKIAEEAGGTQILSSALKYGDFARYTIEYRLSHFSKVELGKPRPITDNERELQFKKKMEKWSSEKRKEFLDLKLAKEKNIPSIIFDKENSKVVFSYDRKKASLVKQREARFLKLLTDKELKSYNKLMRPILFPSSTPRKKNSIQQFDAQFAKRWITNKAYASGWDSKLFPGDHGLGGGLRPRVERIGKKYQWLALFELSARLSDNVWSIGGWPERAQVYDHQATDWFFRDIEPSVIRTPDVGNEKPWWQSRPLIMPPVDDDHLITWPFAEAPPNTPDFFDVLSPDGTPWLLLYGFFSERENKTEKDLSRVSFRRDIFVRITTILVDKKSADITLNKIRGHRLSDPSGHELIEWVDGPFICEYPWRNTWRSDYDVYEQDRYGYFSGIKYIRPIARHQWESHLDLSLKDGSSLCIPNPWIGAKLGLKPNFKRIGDFTDSNGRTIFLDPTYGKSKSSAALINKEIFLKFLEKENLQCLWILAGERNSWPSGKNDPYACRAFTSVFRWTGKEWRGESWFEDSSRLPDT